MINDNDDFGNKKYKLNFTIYYFCFSHCFLFQTVFTVLQSNCEIEPPAYNLCEWKSLPSADRINYLSNIIRTFQADSKRMRETLENAITNAAHKRKAKVQVTI